jgi:hypothetical protein
MDLNRPHPGSPDNPASHIEFQISLLHLMAQKSMAQKSMAQKSMAQKSMAQKSASQKTKDQPRVGRISGSTVGPWIQIMELERLQHPGLDQVRL